MRISSSSEYGLRIMVHLAGQYGQPPVSAEKLSAANNVPRDYVDQILLRLRRAGLVSSRRGAGGGYGLAVPPDRASAADVLRAVEGRIFEETCDKYVSGDHDCRRQADCGLRPVWAGLAWVVEDFLGRISLSQLLAPKGTAAALPGPVQTEAAHREAVGRLLAGRN